MVIAFTTARPNEIPFSSSGGGGQHLAMELDSVGMPPEEFTAYLKMETVK